MTGDGVRTAAGRELLGWPWWSSRFTVGYGDIVAAILAIEAEAAASSEALRLLREVVEAWLAPQEGTTSLDDALERARAYLAANEASRNVGAKRDEPTGEDGP